VNPVNDVAIGTPFTLASPTFLAFALLACCVMLLVSKSPTARSASLFGCNIVFLWLIGGTLHGWLLVAAFVHAVYFLTLLVRKNPGSLYRWIAISGIVLSWLLLFINKNLDIFGSFKVFAFLDVTVIGMSYLAFRAISVLQEATELDDFGYLTFINYMVYFPTLLAGPIERYDTFSNNSKTPEPIDVDVALDACVRITKGFVKKFVLADNLAPLGIFAFGGDLGSVPVAMLWFGVLFQLLLIYLDFSGYCDIVIGIARLMGFKIQENFNRPYLARNIQDFWNSWHMSLTFFVRDYVFTPVCRLIFWYIPKQRQFFYVTAAYFLTMLVIALWHKISWGFLLFGLMHGFALTFIQIKRKYIDKRAAARGGAVAWFIKPPVQVSVALTWTFFSLSTVAWYFPVATTFHVFARLFGLG
jgi:alginate O-acetyltransferase complex protein AlgI